VPKIQPFDNFKIIVEEVPPEELGPVLALLAKAGLKARPELVTNIPSYGQRSTHEVNAEDFLLPWIADHATFRALEAVKHFEANGRSGGGAYPTLAALVDKKVLKKLSPGNYARADVKHLEPPKKAQRTAKGPKKVFDKRGEDVILSYARRNHGRVHTHKLIEIFEAEGRARNSVYASLDGLMKSKSIKRVGEPGTGHYILLNKAKAKPPTKAKPSSNGLDITAVETAEVTHG
jgi:hypothetical protein